MTSTAVSEERLIGMIEELSADQKFNLLLSLAKSPNQNREQAMQRNEERYHALSTQRGLDWERLTDEARIAFVDDLVHSSRYEMPQIVVIHTNVPAAEF